jgi:ferredoxin
MFHWFSGTGNTLWALRRLQAHLEPRGIHVELRALPASPPDDLSEDVALGIAFPVYAQAPPPFVVRWIRSLPPVSHPVPVVVLSTMASMSGMVKGPVARILRTKGYVPWAIREVAMPANYIHPLGDERREEAIRRTADASLAIFARNLAAGTVVWPRRPALLAAGLACSQAVFRPLAAWLGRGFHANPERCTRCRLCVRLCPVGNVHLDSASVPTWGKACEQCLRCINYCPFGAVMPRRLPFLFQPPYRCPGVEARTLLSVHASQDEPGIGKI